MPLRLQREPNRNVTHVLMCKAEGEDSPIIEELEPEELEELVKELREEVGQAHRRAAAFAELSALEGQVFMVAMHKFRSL